MDKKEIEKKYGKVLFFWDIHDFDKYEKTILWYVIAGILGIITLAYSIWTMNFLFAVIILMFAVIILLHDLRVPNLIKCSITETGIVFGSNLYKYSEFENFWILYEPPEIKNLYFEFKGIKPRISIPLEKQDPNKIREILGKYLEEDLDKEGEPVTEYIGRILKI
ncbi:MAG: hypothetical protein HQ536_03725 [Parcubacteria group bacterium]|nr:hypothetical protein [Parcubacteria group bacterium]